MKRKVILASVAGVYVFRRKTTIFFLLNNINEKESDSNFFFVLK